MNNREGEKKKSDKIIARKKYIYPYVKLIEEGGGRGEKEKKRKKYSLKYTYR